MGKVIDLPFKFELRDYQKPVWDDMLNEEYKRGIAVIPRRNGKDLVMWNGLISRAMQKVGLYYYMAPYYNQIRQIIWEGYAADGRRFLDYIPAELIKNKTKLDMRIDLVNGSQIKLQGSDQIDRIVGTNPYGIVFTEFSLHKPEAWEYLRPILAENGGWAWFNGTPRGLNHFYDLYEAANKRDDWFSHYLTRDDTGVPSLEAIEEDRRSGMPEELIKQEYYSSWLSGSVGSYYASYIEALRKNGHITRVPWEPRLPVFTSWDIGVGDANSIWFGQKYMMEYRLIDYYENEGEGMSHYIKVCKEKPYVYGEHFGPHDFAVREYGDREARSRFVIAAEDYNFDFTVGRKVGRIEEKHEAVREFLPRCYFDATNCHQGIESLTHYSKKWDKVNEVFSKTPLHNWASHGANAFGEMALQEENMAFSGRPVHKHKVHRALGSGVNRSTSRRRAYG